MLARIVDTVLDRTIAPGYSRLGYLLRSAGFVGDRGDPAPDDLRGRVVLVTGASSGLGLATVEGLARLGATVHLVVRDAGRGAAARDAVAAAVPGADLHVTLCDLSDLDDVRRAAKELADTGPHVLIHNAGVLPPSRTLSPQGHELAFATHVLGPHLLTSLLAPSLAPDGRVVFVSSGGMYAQKLELDDVESTKVPYSGTAAYARTKRMQVVLTGLWADRLAASGVSVHATHPGWADTPGVTSSLPAFRTVVGPLLRTPDEGADTAVWLSAAPAAVIGTGRFWHDRRARPEHYVPWTRETPADRERLWTLCQELTG
ncbi:MAG: SDR family NAD(P)-dependent oxidoreductase [Pseudonocardia sp.]|uniref:SDR family NAD(P)-dependent oxidoreductase n=1 Tax=Pseudonocardia sp. TaxID=60912 RepID=UPI001AC9B4FF|nr:SDR family NAD(P)-dependent oxidoreductase [Pseudonocardia sp.]MBN9099101.1 SDR family NAD(P)-dependent oxidoreductase [Pseudonocardia sp.]